ncbi:hypothetical protein O1611_g9579 [Lasiodiplodia mahajangana]|uniref:Uncharacterized protein n=1 Tax=Lasiodiplodia mahajangana TaxID=1108764 RepID=A0ACC2J7U7_9PEZI|nr:hypothetical protein O1611_g9579 [Lasiodiplodia mahajangana]
MAKDCPTKPAEVCRNCQEEGHTVVECKNPRKVDRSDIEEVAAEDAWEKISKAVHDKDVDDVKDAIQQYIKACPETTYAQLEKAFRSQTIGVYLIAMENQSMVPTLTNMDLQGNLDKKFRVHYRFDPKPGRPREREFWPGSEEENMARLEDAGEPVNRGLSKCTNCNELGHIAKNCPQEKMERERVVITCFNCNEPGHRMRDCTKERVDKFACKNCGYGFFTKADTRLLIAPNLASLERMLSVANVPVISLETALREVAREDASTAAKKATRLATVLSPRNLCVETATRKATRLVNAPSPRTCPKSNVATATNMVTRVEVARSLATVNSRVQCQNCGEMGHTKVRCKKETVAPDDFDTGNDGFAAGGGGNEGDGGWEKEATAQVASSGDGGGWSGGHDEGSTW